MYINNPSYHSSLDALAHVNTQPSSMVDYGYVSSQIDSRDAFDANSNGLNNFHNNNNANLSNTFNTAYSNSDNIANSYTQNSISSMGYSVYPNSQMHVQDTPQHAPMPMHYSNSQNSKYYSPTQEIYTYQNTSYLLPSNPVQTIPNMMHQNYMQPMRYLNHYNTQIQPSHPQQLQMDSLYYHNVGSPSRPVEPLKYQMDGFSDFQQYYPLRLGKQQHVAQPSYHHRGPTSVPKQEDAERVPKMKVTTQVLATLRNLAEHMSGGSEDSHFNAQETVNTLKMQFGSQIKHVLRQLKNNASSSCHSLYHLPPMLWSTSKSTYFCDICVLYFILKADKFLSFKFTPTYFEARTNGELLEQDVSAQLKRSISNISKSSRGPKKNKLKGFTPVVVLDYNTDMLELPILRENPIGLVNIGSGSCFINAIMQCLVNIKIFAIFYLKYKETLPSKQALGAVYEDYIFKLSKQPLIKSVRKADKNRNYTSFNWEIAVLVNYFWRCQTKSLKPDAIFNNCSRVIPNFDSREMQDCDEYLQNLLNLLDAELITISKASDISTVLLEMNSHQNATGISLIFGGMELDNIKCLNCKTVNSRLIPFRILTLPMTETAQVESLKHGNTKGRDTSTLTKINIQQCLDLHFSKDTSLCVSDGEGYDCNVCKSKQNAEKYCNLVAQNLPNILFITLKRFVCDKQTHKIWNPVEFSETLDLTKYVVDYTKQDIDPHRAQNNKRIATGKIPICLKCYGILESYKAEFKDFKCRCSGHQPSDSKVLYRLIGQIQHEGPSTRQGHYYSYFKHPITGSWYMADDTTVNKLDDIVLTPYPYILIYQRVVTKPMRIELPSFY